MLTNRALLAAMALLGTAVALDNGLARTPPMGWMTWERFRCTADGGVLGWPSCADDPTNCLDEELIRQHADILAQPEWRDAGYTYINIDDCWSNHNRTADGKLVANTTRFPSGMRGLADYVHAKGGLKLGTYNDMGTATSDTTLPSNVLKDMGTGTCGKYPGECKDEQCTLPGYMDVDAATYAEWGIDSLKMDGCNSIHSKAILDPAYVHMGDALNRTGRPVLYSCSWPDYIRTDGNASELVDYGKTASHCNIWRMYNDIQDSWESVQDIADWVGDNAASNGMVEASGPGHFNDPDMLIIGNFALSVDQAKAQMALWSMMAAPLLMGNDLRSLDPEMKEILLAPEVIRVDQDPAGKMGTRVFQTKDQCVAHDVWARSLSNGDTAVTIWNRGSCGTHSQHSFNWTTVGLPANKPLAVRDLFARKDLGVFNGSFAGFVNIDGVLMLRLSEP